MVEKISTYLLDNFLYKGEKIEGDKREVMLFGITRIVEDIPKYLFVLIISIIFHLLLQVGIVFLITVLYKTLVGGAHARTNAECFIFTSLYFFIPALVGKYINIPILYLYIAFALISLYSLYTIYKHVPADTEEIPILNKTKRKKYKIYALISLIIICSATFVLALYNLEYSKIIFSTVFIIDFFTSNLMYKILRCKHSYESEEFKEYFIDNKE